MLVVRQNWQIEAIDSWSALSLSYHSNVIRLRE